MATKTNRFLEALDGDMPVIRPYLREVTLKAGQVLCEPGDPVRFVYFLHEGLVSKLTVFEDGSEIECALVGREGAVGASAALGLKCSITRDVCHLKAQASVVETGVLERLASECERIHEAIDRYCAWKLSYITRNGACNAVHSVEQRLCRWLLTCSDVLEQRQIDLRQDIFAKMLGVQRSTVNPILQRLQTEELIRTGRGRLIIVDRAGLRARACECYGAMLSAQTDMHVIGAQPHAQALPRFA